MKKLQAGLNGHWWREWLGKILQVCFCANSQWAITTEKEWHHGWHAKSRRDGNIPLSVCSFFLLIIHLSATWREVTNGIWARCHDFFATEPHRREWKRRQCQSVVTEHGTYCRRETSQHVEQRDQQDNQKITDNEFVTIIIQQMEKLERS